MTLFDDFGSLLALVSNMTNLGNPNNDSHAFPAQGKGSDGSNPEIFVKGPDGSWCSLDDVSFSTPEVSKESPEHSSVLVESCRSIRDAAGRFSLSQDSSERAEVTKEILEFLDKDNRQLRTYVIQTLRRLGEDAATEVVRLAAGGEIRLSGPVLKTLGYLSRKASKKTYQAAADLIEDNLYRDSDLPDPDAVSGLQYLGTGQARRVLSDALLNSTFGRRGLLLEALGSFEDTRLGNLAVSTVKTLESEGRSELIDIPPQVAYVLTPDFISRHLSDPTVVRLGLRVGYLDQSTADRLLRAEKDVQESAAVVISAVGIATESLLSSFMDHEVTKRDTLIETWRRRVGELQWSFIGEEVSGHREPLGVGLGGSLEDAVDQDLLFAALRELDRANIKFRAELPPFSTKAPAVISGRFFSRSYAGFSEKTLPEWINTCSAMNQAAGLSADLANELLPYMVIDCAGNESETRYEHGDEREYMFHAKWRTASRLIDSSKSVDEWVDDLSRVENRNLWRFGVLDRVALEVSSSVLEEVSKFPFWDQLSPGAQALLRLESYRHAVLGEESLELLVKAAEDFAQRERARISELPSIGIELQSTGVKIEELYCWKEALKYLGVPSPRRPEFYSVTEAAFPPAWDGSVFSQGLPVLFDLGFRTNEELGDALHISLGTDLGGEAKYLSALLLFARDDLGSYQGDSRLWLKAMARVMSKGLCYQNRDSVAVAPLKDAPECHTELRVCVVKTPNDPVIGYLARVQELAGLAERHIGGVGPEDGGWLKIRNEIDATLRAGGVEFGRLLDEDWYAGTGDPRDVALVEDLSIVRSLQSVYSALRAKPSTAKLIAERMKGILSSPDSKLL